MEKPFIVRRSAGEYSTVHLTNGVIETMWFPKDPNELPITVGRTYTGLSEIAKSHINDYEAELES